MAKRGESGGGRKEGSGTRHADIYTNRAQEWNKGYRLFKCCRGRGAETTWKNTNTSASPSTPEALHISVHVTLTTMSHGGLSTGNYVSVRSCRDAFISVWVAPFGRGLHRRV